VQGEKIDKFYGVFAIWVAAFSY